ncbi:MAG: Coenzyme F420 hydrogenase/dehydrogenase, beta subunit C-terminal domain [Butyrivibrio sp.]|nr:Coenzyme F420 hydrogenase/dehydrogenase, beta subunit C-terminal domain [Butyrivibrio sp.]
MNLVEENGNCFGCSACAMACPQHCINMYINEKGFYVPQVDTEKCVKCGKCKAVCQNNCDITKIVNSPKEIFAAKNVDDCIRKKSASGGLFTLLAEFVIQKGGVVAGARFDENFSVVHDIAFDKKGCESFCGSKYAQSDLNTVYKRIKGYLSEDKYVFFTGTPCQVAGLYCYLGRNFDKLLTANLICHGNASVNIYKDFISKLNKKGDLSKICFREKELGWNKQVWSCVHMDNYVEYEPVKMLEYKQLYYSQFIHNENCYNCPYSKYERPGDFTIGDCWGIEKKHPEFVDDLGVSLLFIHSLKGMETFDKIKDRVELLAIAEEDCKQPNLLSPTDKPNDYLVFWDDYLTRGYDYIVKKYTNITLKNKIKKLLISVFEKNKRI